MFMALLTGLIVAGVPQEANTSLQTRWALNVAPAACTLERTVREPFSSVAIETVPGSDSYRLAVANADVRGFTSLLPASLRFDPSQEEVKGYIASAKLSNGTPVIFMRGLPSSALDQLAKAGSISLTAGSEIKGSAQTPNAAAALSALRKCEAEQLIAWGADASQFAPGGKAPVALKNRDEWIANGDLMRIARQSKRPNIDEGFRVAVTQEGVVEDCHALATSTEGDLEKTACAAVTGRRLFAPATDGVGRPVRGAATFRVILIRRPA